MARRKTALSRVLVALSTIVVALVLLLPAVSRATDDGEALPVHTVRAGETLWEIAESATAPGGDVRATVYHIRRLNDLDGSVILPGTLLRVPAPDSA